MRHGGGNSDSEAEIEAGLALAVRPAHIADGENGIEKPQRARKRGEQRAQGFRRETERKVRQHLDQREVEDGAPGDAVHELGNDGHESYAGRKRRKLAQESDAAEEHDQHRTRERQAERERHEQLRRKRSDHGSSPISICAARSASAVVRCALMPR